MPPPATLSRVEFNQACQDAISKYLGTEAQENSYLKPFDGWAWVCDARITGHGYMARTTVSNVAKDAQNHLDTDDLEEELVEPLDESNIAVTVSGANQLYIHECVVWHPTYMVPAYYFQVYDSSGSPTSLYQILATERFRHRAFTAVGLAASDVVLQPQETNNAQFPLLSQGDHPILGTPHWYFHPCETSAAVTEILAQVTDENTPLRWLEAWFAVLSTAIDLT